MRAGHPHVRGDYVYPVYQQNVQHGPSPRAWGLLSIASSCASKSRAIPTCVGTTGLASLSPPAPSGHPHVRGDYVNPFTSAPVCPGHPHVRGDYWGTTGFPVPIFGPSPRAWGLRRALSQHGVCGPGHPHVRGDYSRFLTWVIWPAGPSPRAWGLRNG